jgi:hypothetical protein
MTDPVLAAVIAGTVAIVVSIITNFMGESFKRYKDRVALAGALAGELASYEEAYDLYRASFAALIDDARQGKVANIPKQEVPEDPVFGKTADKLGLLGPHLAEAVAHVYGQLRAARAALATLPGDEHATAERQLGHFVVATTFFRRAHERGTPTIEALRNMAKESYASYIFR